MDISNAQRARVLVHALPYIQDYSGKIVVVKYGGNAMVSEHLKDSVIRDICLAAHRRQGRARPRRRTGDHGDARKNGKEERFR